MRRWVHSAHIIFDVGHDLMFNVSDRNIYILALIAWVTYQMSTAAKFYGIDQWVEEVIRDHREHYVIDISFNTTQQATYIFYQLDTLLSPYRDWLLVDTKYEFEDDTFIVTLEGYPGEKYVKQPLCIEHQ